MGQNEQRTFGVLRAVLLLNGVLLGLSQGTQLQVKPIIVEEQLLWVNGVAGVKEYRCPLLTYTPKGNLLAIIEGRKTSTGDASSKFIVTRRSTDLGFEWSEENFIYDDGPVVDGDNLGAILVDDETATIFLFFTLCPHHVNCTVSSMMYTASVDDGITWKKSVNISAIIQGEGHSIAFGPGRGIQLKHGKHKGRLLACGHSGSIVQCIYSDDHGKSWTYGLSLPSLPLSHLKKGDFAPNENQPEELPDGSVMLNIRNEYSYHCNCRIVGISTDGGETLPLSNVRLDETLIDPVVSGNILMYEGVLFFSNPASETLRMNMTLRWSYNNGTTWAGALPIWSKASGYSCMTGQPSYNRTLKNKKYIYLMFEKGLLKSTETVSLVKISIDGTV